MHVYVLSYFDYEDSEIRGVYTKSSMLSEKKRFADLRRERHEEMINENESIICNNIATRRKLAKKQEELLAKERDAYNTGNIELSKKIHSERKEIIRLIDQMSMAISNLERGIEKMRNMNEDELAEAYMCSRHLSFEEFEVI